MRKYVWTYPIAAMFVITLLATVLQSCGVVRLDRIHEVPTIEELDKKIKASLYLYGGTLFTGFSMCVYLYLELKKLDSKITKLTKDRE